MNHILFLSTILYLIIQSNHNVLAATVATPSSTIILEKTKQIEDLKERLATKVASLRQVEERAIEGIVKSTSVSNTVIETKIKDIKIELTDDIQVIQYLKGKRTILKTENIEKNDPVIVFGEYDTTLDLMKAHTIFIQNAPLTRINGIIKNTDAEAFTITVETADATQYISLILNVLRHLLYGLMRKNRKKLDFQKS